MEKGIHIVQEQLGQIKRSYAVTAASSKDSVNNNTVVTVFYNTIGAANALNATYMKELCSHST
jgi:hypothetical protein